MISIALILSEVEGTSVAKIGWMHMISYEHHLTIDATLDCFEINEAQHLNEKARILIDEICLVRLNDAVPEEVTFGFERAKAAMVYGCYEYALFSVGFEEVLRVRELAIKKALQLSAIEIEKRESFSQLIKKAAEKGWFDNDDKTRWNAAKYLRNSTIHNPGQTIISPSDALFFLESSRKDLEKLFKMAAEHR